jgi:protocatechuate 4,5-dioxygenase, alpha chain
MSSITEMIEADKALARSLEGTYLFDGARAQRNYPLNKMCMSLTRSENRAAFRADEEAYCRKYGLSEESVVLVKGRDWIGMVRSGGNIYYVFKLAAIDHVSMQQVGAQQNSLTLEQFRAKLNSHRGE